MPPELAEVVPAAPRHDVGTSQGSGGAFSEPDAAALEALRLAARIRRLQVVHAAEAALAQAAADDVVAALVRVLALKNVDVGAGPALDAAVRRARRAFAPRISGSQLDSAEDVIAAQLAQYLAERAPDQKSVYATDGHESQDLCRRAENVTSGRAIRPNSAQLQQQTTGCEPVAVAVAKERT